MRTADWRAKFANLNPRPIDLGLDRMRVAAKRLGHPERLKNPHIHVAGTNGKGGVVAALEAAMITAGRTVQTYTSPFLWNFEENIRLNGQSIDPTICAAHFHRLWDTCHNIPLTWFEADTLVAFMAFQDWSADLTLIECGMGGASDATAITPTPLAAILTNVAGDHEEFLGSDLGQVAIEKAGIAKGAPLYVPGNFDQIIQPVHQVDIDGMHPSLALAKAVLSNHFSDVPAREKMPEQTGRWTRDAKNAQIIYDVGHNAHAAAFLAKRLVEEPGPYRLDLGMLKRKNPAKFLEAFQGLDLSLYAIDLGSEGHDPSHLKAIARDMNIPIWLNQTYVTRLITGSHQTVAKFLNPEALNR